LTLAVVRTDAAAGVFAFSLRTARVEQLAEENKEYNSTEF